AIRRHVLRQTKADLGPFDAIMASTMPPVLVAATARRAAKKTGARFLYHMMDIYPEIAWVSGMAKRSPFTRWLAKVDARNCREAARVVVLSTDMKEALAARGLMTDNVVLLNNFRLEVFEDQGGGPDPMHPAEEAQALTKPEGSLRLLFAGNLGRFQGLTEVVEVVRELLPEHPELELHFVGDGVRRRQLEESSGKFLGRGIYFHGHVSQESAAAWTRTADLSLITLQPGIIRFAFPSKTMTCLCEGSAILAMVETDSSLGRMVVEEGVGSVAGCGDREGLKDQIRVYLRHPSATRKMAERAAELGKEMFRAEVTLPGWARLFEEVL
ncbi:MAG: glycosyltransferase family 4 protein, partial [Planctomycetota bacterium]